MCLGVPMQVASISDDRSSAVAHSFGVEVEVNIDLVPDVNVGDYIMIHAGFAIGKVDLSEAEESIALWKEYLGDADTNT